MMFAQSISQQYGNRSEFGMRVTYNFKVHILLCLKGRNWNREDVLQSIYCQDGYKCHKVIRYGANWSHLHVKFSSEEKAKEAINFFTVLNSDLLAVLVDDMLKDWYIYEMGSTNHHPLSLAVVDIIGDTPRSLNFLTESLLTYLFKDFGQPYLLPYTAALPETHVQVLFSSMTEALAACMAFGQWYERDNTTDQFFYRVRINPSHKEASLISNSGGAPEEAFKLDYFVTASFAINQNLCKKEDNPKSLFLPDNRINEYKSKTQKKTQQNCIPQMNYGPIVFVPIIAPLNISPEQAFAAVQLVNREFPEAVLKLESSCVSEQQHCCLNKQNPCVLEEEHARLNERQNPCVSEEQYGCLNEMRPSAELENHGALTEARDPVMNCLPQIQEIPSTCQNQRTSLHADAKQSCENLSAGMNSNPSISSKKRSNAKSKRKNRKLNLLTFENLK